MLQTVMIADDSIPLHALIRAQLSADNLDLVSVYDGTTAVSTAASLHPDLILLDIDMPTMDGFEACRRIKANPATASIPLMFLSADSISADKQKAIALGAFDYLQKPFKPEQLKASVHSRLHTLPSSNNAARLDSLTGLWNKAYFEVQLVERYELAQLASQPISCVVTEIDQLGTINVRFGSKIAKQIIQKVAWILSQTSRAEAIVCRLPNSRFASLYNNCDRYAASRLSQQVRSDIAQTLACDCDHLGVTCSFGVCDSRIASAMTLFDRSACVLHRAIDRGGNCVAVARNVSRFSSRSLLH